MKRSIKGALLSGLVFPGLGQIILKHYTRGLAFVLGVVASVAVIFTLALQKALLILEQIEAEDGYIDLDTITRAAQEATSRSDNLIFNLSFFILVLCWILATVDAYYCGRKQDRWAPPRIEA